MTTHFMTPKRIVLSIKVWRFSKGIESRCAFELYGMRE
jgi:hypothetical protein